jgi:membrane protease YdiL (CAAX protease family)
MRRIPSALFWPLVLALVVGGACVLAAPVHEGLMDLGWMTRHADLHDHDRYFLKVFRRLLLIPLVIVFLWRERPWQRGAGDYGLRAPRARLRPALLGFFGVIAVLVAVLAFQLQQGWLRFEDPLRWGEFSWRACKYLVGGFAAGFLEEYFFRGWLFDQIQRNHGRIWLSVLLSSFLYAAIHAFRPSTLAEAPTHDAAGALAALGAWLAHGFSPAFLAAAAGLFCFALLLTAVYRRTGTLWTAIFVHAGAVLVLFSYGALTVRPDGLTPTWAGTRLLYDGLPVMGLLLLGALLFRPRAPRPRAAPPRNPAPAGG